MKKLILFLSLACLISCGPVIAQSTCKDSVIACALVPDESSCSVWANWSPVCSQYNVIHYDGATVIFYDTDKTGTPDSLLNSITTANKLNGVIPSTGNHTLQFDSYSDRYGSNKHSSIIFVRSYTINCLTSKKKKK